MFMWVPIRVEPYEGGPPFVTASCYYARTYKHAKTIAQARNAEMNRWDKVSTAHVAELGR